MLPISVPIEESFESTWVQKLRQTPPLPHSKPPPLPDRQKHNPAPLLRCLSECKPSQTPSTQFHPPTHPIKPHLTAHTTCVSEKQQPLRVARIRPHP
jgi:hypothetical protein